MTPAVAIGPVTVGAGGLVLIAGPCQIEGRDHARRMAEGVAAAASAAGLPLIFKASYDKANRTSLSGARGVGMERGLEILAGIRADFGLPVLTDVHEPGHCAAVAEAVDVIQIPALLSRQTDLLVAAGRTGRAVNIKKGQFMAPWDVAHAAAKVAATGNRRILLTERGTTFGYNMLVNDFRALPRMRAAGWPVVFDATHSVQEPGGRGDASGGAREFVEPLARAAVAVGVDALFVETHDDPDRAPSDGPAMVPLADLPAMLRRLAALHACVRRLA